MIRDDGTIARVTCWPYTGKHATAEDVAQLNIAKQLRQDMDSEIFKRSWAAGCKRSQREELIR